MPKLRLSPVLLVMNIALVIYGLTALLSLVTAYDLSLSEGTVFSVCASIIIYFALLTVLRKTNRNTTFAALMSILGALFSLLFISQFQYQNYVETPAIVERIGQFTTFLPNFGLFIHPNSASTVIELLLPIVIALLFAMRKSRGFVMWVVVLLVLLYAFMLTYSRGAYLGVGVALLIGLAAIGIKRLSRKQAVALIGGLVGLVVVILVGLVVIGPRVPFVASLMGVTSSRLEIYRNSLQVAGDYAFTGIGLGDTFAMVYSRYSLMIFVPLFSYTHNLLLAILLGQGVLGLAAFVVIVITFYLFVLRVLWVVRIAEPDPVFYGAWIGVTATLVHGLTDARQYVESPFNLPLLFIGMALALSCGVRALREEAFEDRESKKIRGWRVLTLAAVGLVVVLVGGFVIFNKQVMAAWYTNIGALDETRADGTIRPELDAVERTVYGTNARHAYEQALEYNPDYPNANRRLGNMNLDIGGFDAAIPYLEKAYAAEPDYPASIKGLGLAYTWVGRTQEAACVLKALPDVDGMVDELFNWQNYRNEQQQVLLSAYTLETAAILGDYQQTNMAVWVLTGDRYRMAGNNEKAQEWYSRVLDKEANNQNALDGLATMGLDRITIPDTNGNNCN